jgi:hypothetical protein
LTRPPPPTRILHLQSTLCLRGSKAPSDLPTLCLIALLFGYRFVFSGILHWLGLPFTAPVEGYGLSTSFLVPFFHVYFQPAHVPYGVATTASIDFSVSAQDHSAGRE